MLIFRSFVPIGQTQAGIGSFDFIANGSSGAVLSADTGVYNLTGEAATLLYGRRLAAAQGAYVLSGEAANLLRGHVLVAAQGTYSLLGEPQNLLVGHKLVAANGTYTFTGEGASLRRGYFLTAGPGDYALTGEPAGSVYNRVLTAGVGLYRFSGIPATLIYSGAIPARTASGLPLLSVGFLNSNQEMQMAIRDIVNKINSMLQSGMFEFDPLPSANMQVLAQGPDGQWHLWELKAGTGCSIMFDGARYTVTLNVP